MNLHNFYRKYEDSPKDSRFDVIATPIEPISLFVIFKRLEAVRAQQRYFNEQEKHLLALAELGFQQIEDKKRK
jgi:hypothetical protein